MDGREFDDGLLEAYHGERAAIVTLRDLQELALSEEERSLLELVVAVESLVGDCLEPLVSRRGLPVSLDAEQVEAARSRARGMAGWQDVVASFGEHLSGHVSRFRTLQAAAPTAERKALDLLVRHEVALMHFGRFLQAGRVEQGKAVLLAFLAGSGRSDEKCVRVALEGLRDPP